MRTVLGITGSYVFKDRHALQAAYPMKKYFSDIRYRTYGLWLAGRGVFTNFRPGEPFNVEQVILPHPQSDHIAALDASTDMDHGIVASVRQGIHNAAKLGTTVLLYDGWPGVALTFQNPRQENGTLHLEPIAPYLPSVGRPIVRLTRKRNPEAYESYWTMYQRILSESVPAKDWAG